MTHTAKRIYEALRCAGWLRPVNTAADLPREHKVCAIIDRELTPLHDKLKALAVTNGTDYSTAAITDKDL